MPADFDGLAALVTGGASGIGAAVTRQLRSRGARVAVLDQVETSSNACDLSVIADVADDGAVVRAVTEATTYLGGLNILLNNAGIAAQGSVGDNSDVEWHRVLDVNVVGLVRVTRACLPYLREARDAAVVNTCSIVAMVGLPKRALYSASKGTVLSLTLSMATDLMADGIRVNAVAPGTTMTPWIQRLLDAADDPDAELHALQARQPLRRLVEADEVAHAICYLAHPAASAVTGTCMPVDGGILALRPKAIDNLSTSE